MAVIKRVSQRSDAPEETETMTKPTIKFSKFDGRISAGDCPEQDITVDGEYVGQLAAFCDDFCRGMGRDYRVTGYSVSLCWRSSEANSVGLDVKRDCHGDAKPGAARAAHTATKNIARSEFALIVKIAEAIRAAV